MAVHNRRGYRKWASNLDMYRKVPIDLLEGTKRGSAVSFVALFTMGLLFMMETISYFGSGNIQTDVTLDLNKENKVRVNFNITMMDLKCDYVVIDVVSPLGTEQNVTSNVQKYSLDAQGVRDRYKGRNKEQHDIILSDSLVTESLEELHENGEDAISLDEQTFLFAKEDNTYLFVDFYASWCSHCRDLAPTWEVLAEAMTEAAIAVVEKTLQHNHEHLGHKHPDDLTDEEYNDALKVELPVFVAKIDCVVHKALCFEQGIWAYPTLRLFIDGEPKADYRGDRTVLEMIHWLSLVEESHKKFLGEDTYKVKIADQSKYRSRTTLHTCAKMIWKMILSLTHHHHHIISCHVIIVARETLDVDETREEMTKIPERPHHTADSNEHKEWSRKMRRHRTRISAAEDWKDEEHPGCQISGFLFVDRVPGNFHIQARSPSHDIAAHMTNVSHEIHHLSFGEPFINERILNGDNHYPVPKGFKNTLSPLDGNVYINHNEHEAFHHYMKVVTTQFADPYKPQKMTSKRRSRNPENPMAYQILCSSQLSYYRNDIVPEAKFSYDPSPIAVYHRINSDRHWYDYLTSLMAIIGGTFTVLGMIENTIHAAMKKKR